MPIFPSDDFHIERAALRLRAGELVAFATETVYGLGAHALDADAVAKIYAAKGRPSTNPLIVHVADVAQARELASSWPESAEILANAFWPGPLTLVLPKAECIPAIVSAGLESVALRVPSAQTAQRLLQRAGIPLAAPSANASGQVSPTLAAHVIESLGEAIWVLEGGACEIGIESTVVDLCGSIPTILRPGSIGAAQIEALIGVLAELPESDDAPLHAPGMMASHYAPRAQVHLFASLTDAHFHAVLLGAHRKIGVLAFAPVRLEAALETILPLDPIAYAHQIYAQLRLMDEAQVELLLIEQVPQDEAWAGVADRLKRAAHPRAGAVAV